MNLRIEEDEDGTYQLYLVDEYINIQTGWTSNQLVSLNLNDEPALVSKATHPKIHRVLTEALERHHKTDSLVGKQLRVITSDGIYLEAMTGWLVAKSLLVKKIR
jgi:hypothetical protein